MMRLQIAICLLFCFAAMAVAQSSGDDKVILALENGWNQAQVHHDAKALEALVANGFISTDNDGVVMNKAQFLEDAKDMAYKADSAANDEVKVQMYDKAAVVTGRYHTKGTFKGKAFDHWGRFTDTWIYQGGRWQCVASHTSHLVH
jgi:hypothetical protein